MAGKKPRTLAEARQRIIEMNRAAIEIQCPYCSAAPGESCRSYRNLPTSTRRVVHTQRVSAASALRKEGA